LNKQIQQLQENFSLDVGLGEEDFPGVSLRRQFSFIQIKFNESKTHTTNSLIVIEDL